MSGAQTEEDAERLRTIALASRHPDAAPSAGGTAGGAAGGNPAVPVPASRTLVPAPVALTLETVQDMMNKAAAAASTGMRDELEGMKTENARIKASQARLEGQRKRASEINKRQGATASMAKQLDFVEDSLASVSEIRDTLIAMVFDTPPDMAAQSPPGPVSPSRMVCKISGFRDGKTATSELDALILRLKAKLQELLILWNAPSYEIAWDAMRENNQEGAEAEQAMERVGTAVNRAEKATKVEAKRKPDKPQPSWGGYAQPEREAGGWGQHQKPVAPAPTGGAWGNYGEWNSRDTRRAREVQPYPPTVARPVSFSGDAAQPVSGGQAYHASRGIGSNDCAYCREPGHHKDNCPESRANWARKGGGKGGKGGTGAPSWDQHY
jgi:hypothetical protein